MAIALRSGPGGVLQQFQAGETLNVDAIDRLGVGDLSLGASLGALDELLLGSAASVAAVLGDLEVDGESTFSGTIDVTGNIIVSGTVDGVDVASHGARHVLGGADVLDGDQLVVDYTPTNYTRTTGTPGTDVTSLASHLRGVDNALSPQGAGDLHTFPIGLMDSTNLNVFQNTSTWGGIIIPQADVLISGLQYLQNQAGSAGDVIASIYNANTNSKIGSDSNANSSGGTGLKSVTWSSNVQLSKDVPIYVTISCSRNGSQFVGTTAPTSSFNLSPKPSVIQQNSRNPTTINPSQNGSLIWLRLIRA